jgi:hypothetical protein
LSGPEEQEADATLDPSGLFLVSSAESNMFFITVYADP